jgi:hypothetical protein
VTGAFNNTFVEIISGLQVGEKVLLSPSRGIERKPETETKQPKQSSPDKGQPQDNTQQDSQSLEKPVPSTST